MFRFTEKKINREYNRFYVSASCDSLNDLTVIANLKDTPILQESTATVYDKYTDTIRVFQYIESLKGFKEF